MFNHAFLVLDPGPLSTFQDLGRFGYQSLGVPVSGSLDAYSAQAANILAGNEPGNAVLEMTIRGCSLAVLSPAWVALSGAKAQVKLNSSARSVWDAFSVEPGDLLRIGQVSQGCRIYLAINGGFEVPVVMGSRSTYVQAALGGLHGRALRKGDFLPQGPQGQIPLHKAIPKRFIPDIQQKAVLRCVPGPQQDLFQDQGQILFNAEYTVTQRADRRGIRLEGPKIKHAHHSPGSIISEPVLPGNIQVPGDGQPIVLLHEQTVGGYPKIATVIQSDLPKLGQLIPGDIINFSQVSLEAARDIFMEYKNTLHSLQKEIGQ